MTELERLALKRKEAFDEYDQIYAYNRATGSLDMASIITACNAANNAARRWSEELRRVGTAT
jgi:hypothetical protein